MVVGAFGTAAQSAAVTAVAEAARGRFTIIVSSERSLGTALEFEDSLGALGHDPRILKIGDFFTTTIGSFKTEEELLPELLRAKDDIDDSAYFIDLSRACPYTKLFTAGYFGCSLTPWP